MNLLNFIPGYDSGIYLAGREPAFIMLLSFILTYVITRGYTRIARRTGWGSASFGGVHTHHMVFGLVMAFSAGALIFAFTPPQGAFFLLLAALFGCGASLVLDEFALIFHLQDVYWEQEGRKSVDAVVLAVVLGSLLLLRLTPFGTTSNEATTGIAIGIAINLPIVIIAGLKGKLFFALIGIFIPPISAIAAIRLAEPDSIWAHKFYKKNGKKIAKSKKRYTQYEAKWRSKKEQAWDLIGGKTGRPNIK